MMNISRRDFVKSGACSIGAGSLYGCGKAISIITSSFTLEGIVGTSVVSALIAKTIDEIDKEIGVIQKIKDKISGTQTKNLPIWPHVIHSIPANGVIEVRNPYNEVLALKCSISLDILSGVWTQKYDGGSFIIPPGEVAVANITRPGAEKTGRYMAAINIDKIVIGATELDARDFKAASIPIVVA